MKRMCYKNHYGKDYIELNPSVVLSSCRRAYRILQRFKVDTLIYRGTSGTQYAWALCTLYKLNMIQVRKMHDSHSSGDPCIGYLKPRNVAFVDDFMSAGSTRDIVFKEFKNYIKGLDIEHEAKIVCSLFMQRPGYYEDKLGPMFGLYK